MRTRQPGRWPAVRSALACATAAVAAAVCVPVAAAGGAGSRSPAGQPLVRGLAGITVDAHGQALAGVEIRLVPIGAAPGSLPLLRARSGTDGRFSLAALAPGAYRVVAVKGGYSVVVGQINTFLEDTLELILRPSGTPGLPGSRPQDNSWALRLPRRDILEERTFSIAGPGTVSAPDLLQWVARPVFGIDVLAQRADGDAGAGTDGDGRSVTVSAGVLTSRSGLISGRYSHHDVGGERLDESGDALRLRWVPAAGDNGRTSTIGLALQTRDVALAPPAGGETGGGSASLSSAAFDLRHSVESAGMSRDVRLEVDLSSAELGQGADPAETDVARVLFAAQAGRATGRDTQVSFGVLARAVRGARDAAPGLVVLPAAGLPPGAGGTGALAGVAGDTLEAWGEELWQVGRSVTLEARGRAAWTRGWDGMLRGASTVGARWIVVPGIVLHAEGGLLLGGLRAGEVVAGLELSGGGADWNWSVARAREGGAVRWSEGAFASPFDALLLAGPDALADRWTVGMNWRPFAAAELHGRAERIELAGAAAARLPVDLPVTPISGASRAVAERWELGAAHGGTGTSLLVHVDTLRDQPGSALLEGAPEWTRRAVTVRQRLLGASDGGGWYLVLVAEESRLADGFPGHARDLLRAALLDRRRVTGGMSLTF